MAAAKDLSFFEGFSSTGFSLCAFDFGVAKVKTTQAEACATQKILVPCNRFHADGAAGIVADASFDTIVD